MQFKLARAGVKTFAGVIMSAAVLGGMSANAFAERLIKVATEPTFPPFEFVNTQTGEVSGFEMDLVRAVGKELGAKIEFQVLSFDAIIPAMLSGTVEMGAAGFSITEERKKRVLYSDTFYTSGLSLVTTKAKAGAVKSMKDLEGKTIGVQIGTTSHNAAKKVKGAKIVTFNTAGEAILDLSIGGSDAVINDRPVTAYIMTQQPKLGAQNLLRRRLCLRLPQGPVRTQGRGQRCARQAEVERRIRQDLQQVVRQELIFRKSVI